jgi:hypothetical protein
VRNRSRARGFFSPRNGLVAIFLFSTAQPNARFSAITAPRRLPFQPALAFSHASTTSGVTWCGRSEPWRSSKRTRNILYHSNVRSAVVPEEGLEEVVDLEPGGGR